MAGVSQSGARLGRPPLLLVIPAAIGALFLVVPLVTLIADTPWGGVREQLSSTAVQDALVSPCSRPRRPSSCACSSVPRWPGCSPGWRSPGAR